MSRYFGCFIMVTLFFVSCSKLKVIETYEDGNVKSKGVIVDGKKEGEYHEYYRNGQLQVEGLYKSDEKNGVFTYYDSSGSKAMIGEYRDGLRNGIFYEYYPTGQMRGKSEFRMDTLTGESVQYFANGDIRFQSFFERNELIFFEEYDSVGRLIDWKMDFSIEDSSKGGNEHVLLFRLNNQKFNGVRVDFKMYENELSENSLLAEVTKGSAGSEVKVTLSLESIDVGPEIILIGRIFDMEILQDSSNAIVRNFESFEKRISILTDKSSSL